MVMSKKTCATMRALLAVVSMTIGTGRAVAADLGDVPAMPLVVAVPAGAPGHAYLSDAFTLRPVNLAGLGYTEQEYFFSGTARIFDYDYPDVANSTALHTIRSNPYVDRMLVRRPADPAKFSGNVVIEILNDAVGADALTTWSQASRQFTGNGDAWVGFTSTPLGIAALKRVNPARYAGLSFASTYAGRNALNCLSGYQSADEPGVLLDIISQVSSLIKSNAPTSPLSGLPVLRVFVGGYSLSALDLSQYINSVEPTLARPVVDGYMVGSGGLHAELNACASPVALLNRGTVPHSRTAAVFQTQTLSETQLLSGIPLLPLLPFQHDPDSDAAANRYRFYEIAGAAHVSAVLTDNRPIDSDVQAAFGTSFADIIQACRVPGDAFSTFPENVVYDRLWANLEAWASAGTAPPHAPLFLGPDRFGNQLGGIRSPAVDVPVATYSPSTNTSLYVTLGDASISCYLIGSTAPFDAGRLASLYPTHAAYAAAVSVDAQSLVSQGFLTGYDAATLIAQAQAAPVPGP